MNLEEIHEWRYKEEEVLFTNNIDDNSNILIAKRNELQNWRDHQVYEEIVNEGQSSISTRWVISEKVKDGSTVVKARLVARGFEEVDKHVIRKDSPTCSKENMRLILIIAATNHWKIKSLDIRSAFLQGK